MAYVLKNEEINQSQALIMRASSSDHQDLNSNPDLEDEK